MRKRSLQVYGGNYEKHKPADRLLRAGLRDLRRQDRNDHRRQHPALEDRRPVDRAQRSDHHPGHDPLHRLPCGGGKNTLLRQALPGPSLRPGEGTGYLRRLRADGWMSDAGADRRKQPLRAGKSEAVEAGQCVRY